MEWRFIETGCNNAFYNMAVDEALMKLSDKPIIRFYQWKPSAVSIGYFQSVKEEISAANCKKNNIDIVRRATGGKAVLHDNELTYSMIIDEKLMPASIIDSYKKISLGILSALNSLGINAMMKDSIEKKTKSAICFNDPSYYEIVVNDKKIVGSAQTRKSNKLLQHGSILIDIDFNKLFSAFNVLDTNRQNSIKNRMTSLSSELMRKISYKEVSFAMKKGFEKNFSIELIDSNMTMDEIKLTNKLIVGKYSTAEWNLRL